MEIQRISKRGVSFTEEYTAVYLINTGRRLVLCDTHMGPEFMEPVSDYIESSGLGDRDLVIFNTHSDWDHVWGNSVFEGRPIIAQELARKRLEERGAYDLGQYDREDIQLVLPNVTFGDRLTLHDDGIEFIHMPGHTRGCAICIDWRDRVVFAGDLVEDVPVVWEHDTRPWLRSLEFIRDLPVDTIVTSHSGVVTRELIDRDFDYLRSLPGGDSRDSLAQQFPRRHEANRKLMLLSKYEDAARERLGDRFNFGEYKRELMHRLSGNGSGHEFELARQTSYEELEEALRRLNEAL